MKTKYKIYIAGPLYYESERNQRIKERKELDKLIIDYNIDLSVFNPCELPANKSSSEDGKAQKAEDIFHSDTNEIDNSNVVFMDCAENDSGTAVEQGIIIEKIRQGKKIAVYPWFSHISPLGYINLYREGAFKAYGIKIYKNFEEAKQAFIKDVKDNKI